MRNLVFLFILLISCAPKYKVFKSFQKDSLKITILTQSGNLKLGTNEIQVIVNPKENIIKEIFLYMPPINDKPERRILTKLKNTKEGIYEGSISITERGIWDLVIVLSDNSLISERIPIGENDLFGF
ncbi:MAG: hypothetical protein ABIL37_05295 [candidate division WOR-3 bacterium]